MKPGVLTSPAAQNGSSPKRHQTRATTWRRRGFAEWLASSDNPLTARVMVNRIWQHHFGEGIVRTPSNFGKMGERPTHPELLDWLATEFVQNGWSIKTHAPADAELGNLPDASDDIAANVAIDRENKLSMAHAPTAAGRRGHP